MAVELQTKRIKSDMLKWHEYNIVCQKRSVTLLQAWASLQAGILRSLAVHGLNLATRSGGSRTGVTVRKDPSP